MRRQFSVCRRFALLLVFFGLSAASFAQGQRIALITEMKGDVQLARAGSQSFGKADWGTPLYEGDRIRTAASAQAVVLFSNSNLLTISAGNTFTVSAGSVSSPSLSGPVRAVDGDLMAAASDLTLHRAGQGEIEVLGGLRSGGASAPIELAQPRNTKIESSTPVFEWTSDGDFDVFRVVVRSNDGEVWSGETSETMLTYPDTAPVLQPGTTYFWHVEGEDMLDMVASPMVSFEVLGESDRERIRSGMEQINALFDGPEPTASQLFMIGSMYVKTGLMSDAIVTFKQITEVYPSSPMTYEILGKLYYEIGLKDEAVRALQTAIALK